MKKRKSLNKLKPPGYMIRILRNQPYDTKKKMSQAVLGEKTGLSHAQISRKENGKNGGGYNREFIEKVCDVFQITPFILFACNEEEADFLKAFHKALK